MGSKARIPPPHLRRPIPGSAVNHPDPFGPGMMRSDPFRPDNRPPPGHFPPFDMLPPPEIMEQKLTTQLGEMQRLATENQRLAATHVVLRQELASAQQESQRLQAHIGAVKNEKEQQIRGLMDNIAKMEADLKSAESVKIELQKAHGEAQNLMGARQELISKVQQLTHELQKIHSEVQQIPALTSELDALRQEFQHCRTTYDYEKKLYNDHLESLQVMEKNYMMMVREVEKLRVELAKNASIERTGVPFAAAPTGYKENEAGGNHPVVQNAYEDGYGVPQGYVPPAGATPPYVPPAGAAPTAPHFGGGPAVTDPGRAGYDVAQRGPGYDAAQRGPGHDAAQRGPGYDAAQRGPGYDAAQRGPGYDAAQRGPGYDAAQRGPGYDAAQRGPGYNPSQRVPGYDPAQRWPVYDASRGAGYNVVNRGPGYDAPTAPPTRGHGYDPAAARGAPGPQGQPVGPGKNPPYGSATPPTRPVPGGGGSYNA